MEYRYSFAYTSISSMYRASVYRGVINQFRHRQVSAPLWERAGGGGGGASIGQVPYLHDIAVANFVHV